MKTFTGIGSRSTPVDVLKAMSAIARKLVGLHGYVVRSGGARGADQSFAEGSWAGGKPPRLYLPWPEYEQKAFGDRREWPGLKRPTNEAMEIAERWHPKWDDLAPSERLFHGRNTHCVLGEDCESPSRFLICWTPEGQIRGGTAQGIRIAEAYEVPVYNLAIEEHVRALYERLGAM